MSAKKNALTVPTIETVETVEIQPTAQEESTVNTQVEEVEIVETVEEVAQTDVELNQAVEEFEANNSEEEEEEVTVTLAEIEAFQPDAINTAIEEVMKNHSSVNMFIRTLPETTLATMRESLGISDNLEHDIETLTAALGGNVAALMPSLKDDSGWENVIEYMEMINLLDRLNEVRSMLNLPILSVKIGGKLQGAARSTSASIHPKRTGGFMAVGTFNGRVLDKKVQWQVTPTHIVVRMNGAVIYTNVQGYQSLSKIHNNVVLRQAGAAQDSRQGMPEWLKKNGFDPDKIMLQTAPHVTVEA